MTAPTPSMQGHPPHDQFIHEMERLVLLQQETIATLKLAAYAADAMRVLFVFERYADMSQPLDGMLKSVCSDGRNPGSIDQPADLIATVLAQAIAALQKSHGEMGHLMASISANVEAGALGSGRN